MITKYKGKEKGKGKEKRKAKGGNERITTEKREGWGSGKVRRGKGRKWIGRERDR